MNAAQLSGQNKSGEAHYRQREALQPVYFDFLRVDSRED